MSESFAHKGGIDPDGWATTSGGSIDEALAAEIADHLAAAASDFVKQGAAEEQAAALALARFGNVAKIKRQCWWIQKGDEVMFRTLGVAILSLLAIGVVAVALGGWQLGRNLASRTDELSEQLASLTATQQAMLAQQRPPTVTGRCYLGDPSKPAKNVEVQVFRFSEEPQARGMGASGPGVVTRRLRTDSEGRFDSGILQAGEYCLLAPLLDPSGAANEQGLIFSRLQSRPLNLTAGVGESKIDLDLAATGRIQLAVNGIPNNLMIGTEPTPVFVWLNLYTEGDQRYFEHKPIPPSDVPPRDGWPVPLPPAENYSPSAMLQLEKLPHTYLLTPREYQGELYLSCAMTNALIAPIVTKRTPISLKVSPNTNATLTVTALGEPLEQRLEAAIKESEKSSQKKLIAPEVIHILPAGLLQGN